MSSSPSIVDPGYRRALGKDLILRWATVADGEGLSALYAQVYRDEPDEPPNKRAAIWTHDMMSGRHPLIGPDDFAVVEYARDGTIVAGTCLYAQLWTYAGIDLPVGRPEAVATREEFRNRGLIRAIFELIHARSAAHGHLAQGITGIPYYYRQFGYEYALDLEAARSLPLSAIPRLKEGQTEPYRLREATLDDIPLLGDLYDRDRAYALTSTRIDAAYWRWMLAGMHPDAAERWRVCMIVDGMERACGYVIASYRAWREGYNLWGIGMAPGVSLAAALPAVLRALREVAVTAPRRPTTEPPTTLLFSMGREHPVYEALGDLLPPASRRPYGWYVRVPDVRAFLRRIAPVLERRLHTSVVAGYTGELKLDFYRGGLRLVFGEGRLELAEDWRRGAWDRPDAGCPPLVFLQLLCGYRGLDELRDMFPDAWAADTAVPLLRALFPAQPSWVIPLD
jgi:hypothetical protein